MKKAILVGIAVITGATAVVIYKELSKKLENGNLILDLHFFEEEDNEKQEQIQGQEA